MLRTVFEKMVRTFEYVGKGCNLALASSLNYR